MTFHWFFSHQSFPLHVTQINYIISLENMETTTYFSFYVWISRITELYNKRIGTYKLYFRIEEKKKKKNQSLSYVSPKKKVKARFAIPFVFLKKNRRRVKATVRSFYFSRLAASFCRWLTWVAINLGDEIYVINVTSIPFCLRLDVVFIFHLINKKSRYIKLNLVKYSQHWLKIFFFF